MFMFPAGGIVIPIQFGGHDRILAAVSPAKLTLAAPGPAGRLGYRAASPLDL
jgi:hypothetical protein